MTYPGGKNGHGVYQTLINQIPPHDVLIEAFAGSATIARLMRPARSTILIDADATAVEQLSSLELPMLQAIHGSALDVLRARTWTGQEFVYCDPPYLWSVRSTKERIYRHEFHTEEEHLELITLLRTIPAPVMISGYASALYACHLADWRSISYTAPTHGGPATEWAWMNYPEPTRLHDFRYLGEDYRKRQHIKRKKLRWAAKLQAMPRLERLALMAALEEIEESTASSELTVGALETHIVGNGYEVLARHVGIGNFDDNSGGIVRSDEETR